MNQTPDPSITAALTQQLVSLLATSDPETRKRATRAAMVLLGDEDAAGLAGSSIQGTLEGIDIGGFFDRDEDLKPADNAYLCAAYFVARHGLVPFALSELRAVASEAGVILPERIDMTLKQAGGKRRFFQAVGKDEYKPTAAAATYFKERWGVKPGRQPKT